MRIWLILLPVLLLIAGCGLVAPPPPVAAVYELRLPATDPAVDREVPEFPGWWSTPPPPEVEVTAPSWLRNRGMQYRLDYRDNNQRRTYLESRWVAEPAEMIARALARYLAAMAAHAPAADARPTPPAVLPPPCRLHLSLDEFIQVFSDQQHNYTLLQVRAELLTAAGRTIGHRRFTLRQESASPDAAGGVAAHRRSLQNLAAELVAWLAVGEVESGCPSAGFGPQTGAELSQGAAVAMGGHGPADLLAEGHQQ